MTYNTFVNILPSDFLIYTPAFSILFICLFSYFASKFVLTKIISKIILKSKNRFDDVLYKNKVLYRISYLIPVIILYNSISYLSDTFKIIPYALALSFFNIIFLILFAIIINSILTSFAELYGRKYKRIPIKSYIQLIKIGIYMISALILISILINKSPLILLSGLGALSAILLFIFRDTILSIVANLQISSNDLVQLNDWIEAPTFGADGAVIEIALHTLKVQNWDKTIIVIPTHKLIDSSFKNWRGMTESGGRRIMRSIFIDLSSVKFCDEPLLKKLRKINILKNYIVEKEKEINNFNISNKLKNSDIVNSRRLTNIGVFRIYLGEYLKNHPKINENMTFMVRQLAPTDHGLPLQIYVFTTDNEWIKYEKIQSDVFDHVLAVISEFDLKLFQKPTGYDIVNLKSGNTNN